MKQSLDTRCIGKSYLALIRNSLGSQIFQNFYLTIDGEKKDVMQGGVLSCAFFVSTITTILGLTQRMHGTVQGVLQDLKNSGWQEIKDVRPGAILVWETVIDYDDEIHSHIGFCLDDTTAISNSSMQKVPVQHHITFAGTRNIVSILWHPLISEDAESQLS